LGQLRDYRAMVQDKNHVTLWISPGKHGRQIREKYFKAGKPCPVLISCGHDPLLFLAAGNEIKQGLSEYDYAGGHRGEPYEIVQSELYGLRLPAHAEIVLEGEMVESVTAKEGPFGELPAITRQARASSRGGMCGVSIGATIRSSRSPRRCGRRPIFPSANA